jgi:C-7 ketoreductase
VTTAVREHDGMGVIVTGGGGGIGRATAQAFARGGAHVLVVGRTEAKLAETAKESPNIHTLVADITEPDSPSRVVETALARFGRLDVLVNNAAAVARGEELETLDRAVVDSVIATNLYAPMFLTKHALKALEASGGTVVNLSTAGVQAMRGIPSSSAYGASKVALDFLTRTWAIELAPRGIRVIGVAPSVLDTDIHASFPREDRDKLFKRMAERTPSRRLADPAEIGWWIAQLTRREAGYLNGVVIPIDGGLSST